MEDWSNIEGIADHGLGLIAIGDLIRVGQIWGGSCASVELTVSILHAFGMQICYIDQFAVIPLN